MEPTIALFGPPGSGKGTQAAVRAAFDCASRLAPDFRSAAPRRSIRLMSVRRAPQHRSLDHGHQEVAEQLALLGYVRARGVATSVTYLSGRMETLLGHGLKEIDGPDGFARLLHPDDRDRVLAKHDEAPGVGRRPAVEYRLLARDGSIVWVRDEALLVREGDDSPFLRGHCLDITPYKRVEAELRVTGYVTRLAAIELCCAAQAVDLRGTARELGQGSSAAYAAVRAHMPFVSAGQAPLDDLAPLVTWLEATDRDPDRSEAPAIRAVWASAVSASA